MTVISVCSAVLLIASCDDDDDGDAPPPDDAYEDNDTYLTAWDFSGGRDVWLSAHGGALAYQRDDDWYEISAQTGRTRLIIDCTFTHDDGDIDIELCGPDGVALTSSDSTLDSEHIDYDISDDGLTGGVLYVRVFFENAGNLYDLRWVDAPPDDSYEDNDLLADATDFTAGAGVWLSDFGEGGVQADRDWFEIDVPTGSTLVEIECVFLQADGDIDIELRDDIGRLLETSASDTDDERILRNVTTDGFDGGTFYIVVTGDDERAAYDLRWQVSDPMALEDAYEENDILGEAWDFTGGEGVWLSSYSGLGLAAQVDEDWYKIEILTSGNTRLIIDCIFTHADGDISIDLLDAGGVLLAFSDSATDNEAIDHDVSADGYLLGVFYVRVLYSDVGNTYDFMWQSSAP